MCCIVCAEGSVHALAARLRGYIDPVSERRAQFEREGFSVTPGFVAARARETLRDAASPLGVREGPRAQSVADRADEGDPR
ncbi:hypothetical protein ENSA5_68090 [Enhygromyxa salina]|uniref:Uncharacterized protein n=1 Tax=Enhygromyxa salina TaxID=215803 RepID=A0A2S9XB35_9BACT|nr:hypothetical protein ENSA5_68090 [Enhygromyxa salina]